MKPILCVLLSLLCLTAFADGPIITGNIYPAPGATEIYTSNWDTWDQTHETYANVTWQVAGGTVLAQDKHTVTIQWSMTQNNLDVPGSIYVMEDLSSEEAWYSVTVLDATPGASQICSGILGTAKVAESFGAGPNPGPAITTGGTTYTYEPFCAIDVNQYAIVNSEPACRSGWWNIPHDHTGNPNGYMMMVNGNDTRGEFYRTTISGLNSAYAYEFSAWVGNLFDNGSGADPSIRFQVYDLGGNELLSSGSIDVPPTNPFAWQQIGYMVQLPPGVTAVQIVLVDLQNQGFGNDIVVDDISFAPCYPALSVLASFSSTASVVTAHVCTSGSVNLYGSFPGNTNPFTNPSYQWERSTDNGATWSAIPGANTLNASYSETAPGAYVYRMHAWETANPAYYVYSNYLYYYVAQLAFPAHTFDLYACTGAISQYVLLNYTLNYADPNENLGYTYYTFNWAPANGTAAGYINPTNYWGTTFSINTGLPADNGPAEPVNDYYYNVTVTNTEYGCTASSVQTFAVHVPRKVYVPNAFTPGQPTNSLFRPINIEDYPGSTFQIFDRWGVEVWNSTGPTLLDYSWDGTYNGSAQPSGTFAWQVNMVGCPTRITGSAIGDGVPYGTVELIR